MTLYDRFAKVTHEVIRELQKEQADTSSTFGKGYYELILEVLIQGINLYSAHRTMMARESNNGRLHIAWGLLAILMRAIRAIYRRLTRRTPPQGPSTN